MRIEVAFEVHVVVEYGEVGLVQGDYAVCALRFGFRSLAVCGEPFYFKIFYFNPVAGYAF